MSIYIFLTMPISKFVIAPLLTILIGNTFKLASQRKTWKLSKKEYFYIGPNTLAAGFLLSLIELSHRLKILFNESTGVIEIPTEMIDTFSILALIFLLIPHGMSKFVKKYGWTKSGRSSELDWIWGVAFPDAVGLTVLFIVFSLLK